MKPTSAHEAAILFAANFDEAAIGVLRGAIDAPEAHAQRSDWLMLFELFRLAGKRDEFDALLLRYGAKFAGSSRPLWGFPDPVVGAGAFRMPAKLSAQNLRELVQFAGTRNTVAIDMGQVIRIEFGLAHSVAVLLRDFHVQGRNVILANISELLAVLLEAMGSDRHAVLMRRKGMHPERESSRVLPRPYRETTPQPIAA